MLLRIALPWILYVAVLAALALVDRMKAPETTNEGLDLDRVVNVVALLGLLIAGWWSVAAVKDAHRSSPRNVHVAAALAGGVMGPVLGTAAVTAVARDVDGGMWMLYYPVLGLLVVGLGILFLRRAR